MSYSDPDEMFGFIRKILNFILRLFLDHLWDLVTQSRDIENSLKKTFSEEKQFPWDWRKNRPFALINIFTFTYKLGITKLAFLGLAIFINKIPLYFVPC